MKKYIIRKDNPTSVQFGTIVRYELKDGLSYPVLRQTGSRHELNGRKYHIFDKLEIALAFLEGREYVPKSVKPKNRTVGMSELEKSALTALISSVRTFDEKTMVAVVNCAKVVAREFKKRV